MIWAMFGIYSERNTHVQVTQWPPELNEVFITAFPSFGLPLWWENNKRVSIYVSLSNLWLYCQQDRKDNSCPCCLLKTSIFSEPLLLRAEDGWRVKCPVWAVFLTGIGSHRRRPCICQKINMACESCLSTQGEIAGRPCPSGFAFILCIVECFQWLPGVWQIWKVLHLWLSFFLHLWLTYLFLPWNWIDPYFFH